MAETTFPHWTAGDGYSLSAGGWDTHVMNGALYPLSYDVVQDFEPISLIARLNAAVVDALANSSVRSRLAALGQDISPREQRPIPGAGEDEAVGVVSQLPKPCAQHACGVVPKRNHTLLSTFAE